MNIYKVHVQMKFSNKFKKVDGWKKGEKSFLYCIQVSGSNHYLLRLE